MLCRVVSCPGGTVLCRVVSCPGGTVLCRVVSCPGGTVLCRVVSCPGTSTTHVGRFQIMIYVWYVLYACRCSHFRTSCPVYILHAAITPVIRYKGTSRPQIPIVCGT